MMNNEVIGYKKFTSKSGNACCILFVVSDVSARDKMWGCVGRKVTELFIPESLHNLINENCLGKSLDLVRDFSGEITQVEFV